MSESMVLLCPKSCLMGKRQVRSERELNWIELLRQATVTVNLDDWGTSD